MNSNAQDRSASTIRIMGIDPGLRITGYGCLDLSVDARNGEPRVVEAGVLRLNTKTAIESRLHELHVELGELLDQLQPDCMAVEKLYSHYAHPTTAIKMGHARGVILLAGQERQIKIEEFAATEIKKCVTGHGHASKEQMQHAVQALCHLQELPTPNDVADALAIALTSVRHLDRPFAV